jgi:UDP-N-acetyl-2-amino-2-deoxyglucuronate dehydrogenase
MKNFALIGAAGYIAKRHVEAIKSINGNLIMMCDPNDNVGYIDSLFPNCKYFKEIERFDRQLNRFDFQNDKIDYVSICSPNYLHDSHIRLSVRNNCNVICEKPLVLKTEHLNMLKEVEAKYNKKVLTILQLRLHPVIKELKKQVQNSNEKFKIKLKYITPRGMWYDYSWKGDIDKSGGVLFNIGIHFFDMLIWIFGEPVIDNVQISNKKALGTLNFKNAEVEFYLSIDYNDLPHKEWKAFRSLNINDKDYDFSEGFTELHNISYEKIINGEGFGINDIFPAIELIEKMNSK